jgi:hypothetical protein
MSNFVALTLSLDFFVALFTIALATVIAEENIANDCVDNVSQNGEFN